MDALKIYEDALDDLASDLITEDEFTKIIKCLRDVQEVRHGRWEDTDMNESWCVHGRCSVCDGYTIAGKYCSRCGAKMDEEVE